MKYADISGLAGKEMNVKIKQLSSEIFEARMKNALGQLANPMTIRHMRRDIARLKTAQAVQAQLAPPVAKKTVEKTLKAKAAKPATKPTAKAKAPKKTSAQVAKG